MTDPTPLAGRDAQAARAGAGMGSGPDPEKPHPRGSLATGSRMAAQQPWLRRGSARGSDGGAAEEAASGRATRPPAEGTGSGRWAVSRESRLKQASAAHTPRRPRRGRARETKRFAPDRTETARPHRSRLENRAAPPVAAGEGPEGHTSLLSWLVQTSYSLLSQHGYGHVVLPPAVTEGAALKRKQKSPRGRAGIPAEAGPRRRSHVWILRTT